MAIDETKLNEFLGTFVTDLGATMNAPLVVLGDRLGLYKGLAEGGPQTPAELATRTGTAERYVREWLLAQAAGGYVTYEGDDADPRFYLTEEQAFCLADDNSPAFVPGGLQVALSTALDRERIEQAFRTGSGVGWHEHHEELFVGTERFFRPGYLGNLLTSWVPSLDGVEAKLRAGATIADVGCGHGASTIILAEAFPESTIVGFDYHEASIEVARKRAAEAGVGDRVRFEVAKAQDFPGTGFDLVCFFDCLHDMADPEGAIRHVRQSLADDGTWMLVEPIAWSTIAESLNPVGRAFYGASTSICTPAGLDGEPGAGLGNQVSDERWAQLTAANGFTRIRRAAETPFNRVFEVRP
ncbi:MAG TPA: class I SAM-dependent methyltransferase [Acidimicrobiales bacterium]|nr:class I SAM-dependent methyltransferase [Acidimicrobiales bacterium]